MNTVHASAAGNAPQPIAFGHRLLPPALRELLPEIGSEVPIAPLQGARLFDANRRLAAALGLADAGSGWPPPPLAAELTAIASGQHADCRSGLATVYSGHQFGLWAGQLGDGRAAIIGSLRDEDGVEQEIQLKGAGPTPYSRFADGRAVIRSTLREYLASEALHGLGIATTRALAMVVADTPVQRERVEQAAVLYRVAPSHLRFGHFEHFAAAGDEAMLHRLADHLQARFWPALDNSPEGRRQWLADVLRRTAEMVADWQAVGFCHGVMNTDNFSMLGLTIDYGPYGFLEAFDSAHICNHSDHEGRYAYGRQPAIAQWNAARLLSACLPLLGAPGGTTEQRLAIAQELLDAFAPQYRTALLQRFRAKLGLGTADDGDSALVEAFLERLQRTGSDFSRSFRALADWHAAEPSAPLPEPLRTALSGADGGDWLQRYRQRCRTAAEAAHWRAVAGEDPPRREAGSGQADDAAAARARQMRRHNPVYVLRNWLAQEAIAAAEAGDPAPTRRLLQALSQPFTHRAGCEDLDAPAPDWAAGLSVSCSS